MADMINLEIAIRDLVHANEGFWMAKQVPVERRTPTDWNSIKAWSENLLAAQQFLGILVVEVSILEANLRDAGEALTAKKDPF